MEVQDLIDEAVNEAETLIAAAKSEGDRDLTNKESERLAELEAHAKALHDKVTAQHQADQLVIEQRQADLARLESLKGMKPIDKLKMGLEAEPEVDLPKPQAPAAGKTLGEAFVSSKAYAEAIRAGGIDEGLARAGHYKAEDGVSLKTLLTSPTRGTSVSVMAQEYPQATRLMDLLTVLPSSSDTVLSHRYNLTEAAAETAEGVTKPEAAMVIATSTINPKKVAVSLPVTVEALSDHPRMRAVIDTMLSGDVTMAVESLVATDLAAWSGLATTAFNTDITTSVLDGKVAANVYTTADSIIMSDTNWTTLALTAAAVGQTVASGPFGPATFFLWGLPVISSASLADGFAYVGRASNLVWNEVWPMRTATGWVAQQFVENELTILVETRGSFMTQNNLHTVKADIVTP